MTEAFYHVVMTPAAEADLVSIYEYLAEEASEATAARLVARLLSRLDKLERFPNRGPVVRELAEVGMGQFRQVTETPYRLIYRVTKERVYVVLVADGRRDVRALLMRRLTGTDN